MKRRNKKTTPRVGKPWKLGKLGKPRTAAALAGAGLLGVWLSGLLLWPGALPVHAQQLAPGRALPPRAGGPAAAETLAPATVFAPERVRTQLRGFHGFTRARLDAVSTDVPSILRGWIADPDEPMLIRRQAIKALKLYPSAETFAFIRGRISTAPPVLQMLFLGSLQPHAAARPDEVGELVKTYLDGGDVVVRHAAVALAEQLDEAELRRGLLRKRLAVEPDPAVRRAINRALSAP